MAKLNPKRWSVGIDPGYAGTGLVLLADAIPIASALAAAKQAKPVQQRTRRMGKWMCDTIQEWIYAFEITHLDVIIELAFLRTHKTKQGRIGNVKTLGSQMRMLGVYEDRLYDLEGCVIRLGEVVNTTAKKAFTGSGQAPKDIMIAHSVWATRTDLGDWVEHLADAQAIGSCYPTMVPLGEDPPPMPPRYEDGAIGEGLAWAPKKRQTRSKK